MRRHSPSGESSADVDARWDEGESSGEETTGGNIGVTYADGEPLRVGEKDREHDRRRWELNPASSEDFRNRSSAAFDAEPILKMRHRDRYQRAE